MIPFPDISPELFSFSLGSIELALRWYSLSYIFGFMIALYLMRNVVSKTFLWKDKSPKMELAQVDTMLTYLIFGVIIGGRLGYVFFYNLDFYLSEPVAVFRLWDGGMSFHGGFLGVVFAVFIFCIRNGLPVLSIADLVAFASPPGLFLGRCANFINNELWGRPTSAPWGVIFPGDVAQNCPEYDGLCARHPTQIYEAGLEGFALFLILYFLVRLGYLKRPGFITGVFGFFYGLSRFIVEFYRVPDPQFFSSDNPFGFAYSIGGFGVTMGQALSLPMIAVGLLLVIIGSGSNHKTGHNL